MTRVLPPTVEKYPIVDQQNVVDFEFLWTVEVHIQNHKNDPKEVHDNERESTKNGIIK